jgi:hypothetical protein
MNNDAKVCPLLSVHEEDSLVWCQGEKCAWYVPPVRPGGEGRCAVQCLGALPELVKGVKEL